MKDYLYLTLVTAFCCLISLTQSAFAKDYIIDVVIFENSQPGGPTGFSDTLQYPVTKDALRLGTSRSNSADFMRVKSHQKIDNIVTKIQSSRDYRLLKHITWQQPGLAKDNAKALKIVAGKTISIKLPLDSDPHNGLIEAISPETTASMESNYRDIAAFTPLQPSQSVNTTELAGSLTVTLGKYLHLNTRLVLTRPNGASSAKMILSRRMRSKEIHYLDTPSLGLIVLITPVATPIDLINE